MQYFAFLRAINVGGHTVKMAALKTEFEAFGFTDVETFIASGNVIFSSRARGAASIERTIEAGLERALGYEVKTFVRTAAEIAGVLSHTPFPARTIAAARSFNVGFLVEPLPSASVKTLMSLRTDADDFHVHGRELYWLCKTGQGESAFSNAVFEKATKARTTFRGMKTVVKLAEKYGIR